MLPTSLSESYWCVSERVFHLRACAAHHQELCHFFVRLLAADHVQGCLPVSVLGVQVGVVLVQEVYKFFVAYSCGDVHERIVHILSVFEAHYVSPMNDHVLQLVEFPFLCECFDLCFVTFHLVDVLLHVFGRIRLRTEGALRDVLDAVVVVHGETLLCDHKSKRVIRHDWWNRSNPSDSTR